MPAAILVMLVIILLNVALLIAVMRIGTQGEHHSEFAADQSSAVAALRSRISAVAQSVEEKVEELAEDLGIAEKPAEESTGDSE